MIITLPGTIGDELLGAAVVRFPSVTSLSLKGEKSADMKTPEAVSGQEFQQLQAARQCANFRTI
jgi:hypothetical protein